MMRAHSKTPLSAKTRSSGGTRKEKTKDEILSAWFMDLFIEADRMSALPGERVSMLQGDRHIAKIARLCVFC